MILNLLVELVLILLDLAFGWVSFPPMPDAVTSACGILLSSIESAMGFLWLVLPRELVLVILPIILLVTTFDKLYSIVMWIIRKLPALGMT